MALPGSFQGFPTKIPAKSREKNVPLWTWEIAQKGKVSKSG